MNYYPEQSQYDHRKAFWYIAAIAVILRVITALLSDNLNHPDENFQIMEQAHRLAFGYGIIPWEYRLAARSWLTPGLMAGILYPFKLLSLDNPNIYIPGIKIILSLFSIPVIWAMYHIGRVLHSPKAGLISAFLYAIWYECVYFSIRPLSEVGAANFLILSVALFLTAGENRKIIIMSGLLAVLTMAFRISYIPAVLVLVLIQTLKLSGNNRMAFLFSFIGGILAVGIFEWLTLGGFYTSYINYYEVDKTFFMGGGIGSSFSWDYLLFLGYGSLFIFWIFIVGGCVGWKRAWPVLSIVFALIIPHVLLPVKSHEIDYRHIYAVIPLLLIIGGIFIVSINDSFVQHLRRKSLLPYFIGLLALISFTGALGKIPGQKNIYINKIYEVYNHSIFYSEPRLEAYRYIYNLDTVAGVYDASGAWFRSGGFYYLHRDVPLYYNSTPPKAPEYVSHIISRSTLPVSMGFGLATTFDDIKVYARSDKSFIHLTDPDYTRHIYQEGVDDRPVDGQ